MAEPGTELLGELSTEGGGDPCIDAREVSDSMTDSCIKLWGELNTDSGYSCVDSREESKSVTDPGTEL